MIPIHIKEVIEKNFPKCEGWCTVEKAFVLIDLILQYQPKLCFESGIFGGRSFIAQGLALKELGRDHIIYGADPWDVEAALEGDNDPVDVDWWKNKVPLEQIYIGCVHWICTFGVTWQCRWLRMRSDMAAKIFDDKSVHWFHQDSNHSEQVSCREVRTWEPKMAEHSIWVLDDADWPTQQNTVKLIESFGYQRLADHKTFIVFKR